MRWPSRAGASCGTARTTRADEVEQGLAAEVDRDFDELARRWPAALPAGIIHADLFPDNVFFLGDRLSGLIDFYFACNDLYAYDVATWLNAWCFEKDHAFNLTKGTALLAGYQSVRPLSTAEKLALPVLARGSALRFMLTRLYDWLTIPDGALIQKRDPTEYIRKLRFHRQIGSAREYGVETMKRVEVFTDGACSGNPGPGGWGAILRYNDTTKELSGGEADTTNNRMELMAAIEALNALKQPVRGRSLHRQQLRQGRHRRLDRRLEAQWLEDGRQEAGQERRAVASARRGAQAPQGGLALGEGPRRPCRKRARRRTGAPWHGAVQAAVAYCKTARCAGGRRAKSGHAGRHCRQPRG